MYKLAKPLFLICETPLHAGSGSDLGIVDLPIQRERHTSFPKIEASSLKGALREAIEHKSVIAESNADEALKNLEKVNKVFGYDEADLDKRFNKKDLEKRFTVIGEGNKKTLRKDFAGAIGFTDARLLLFPVKSMKGIFAWVTCPRVIQQFVSDMKLSKAAIGETFEITNLNDTDFVNPDNTYLFHGNSNLKIKEKVILEEYTFDIHNDLNGNVQVKEGTKLTDFPDWLAQHLFKDDGSYWSEKIKKDVVLLTDDDFKDFVNLSTEVITRTRIDNITGTVDKKTGALFTEEYLPAESVLYSLVLAHDEFSEHKPISAKNVLSFFKNKLPKVLQIGGNATLGKGLVRVCKSLI